MKTLLGVVHLRPLPSAARHESMDAVLEAAHRDARALAEGGVGGLVVENFGDAPFHRGTIHDPVPPDVPAAPDRSARSLAAAAASMGRSGEACLTSRSARMSTSMPSCFR